jgi:Cytochrome c554 and c-prime
MVSLRYVLMAACVMLLAGRNSGLPYFGSVACNACHASQFATQSKTGHAHALRRAQPTDPGPGSHAQWAFGAGAKAATWVSQTGEESIAEHGLSYYTATKTLGLTPGHETPTDLMYRAYEPVEGALRCVRCHTTGPVTLAAKFEVQPGEPGVSCEACHGPGCAHAEAGGAAVLMKEAGQTAAGDELLRQSLDIYEKSLGSASEQAQFVREHLARDGR